MLGSSCLRPGRSSQAFRLDRARTPDGEREHRSSPWRALVVVGPANGALVGLVMIDDHDRVTACRARRPVLVVERRERAFALYLDDFEIVAAAPRQGHLSHRDVPFARAARLVLGRCDAPP